MRSNGAAPGEGTAVDGRLLARVAGDGPGPLLLCVAGVHGNEPAGIHAVRRVLGRIEARRDEMGGDFVALAGNLSALARGRRFVDRDLNRAWTSARLHELRARDTIETAEDREQLELLESIDGAVSAARGPVYALDLHTTSGPGGIFSAFSDSLRNRAFAEHFPVPMVLGLEEQVDGTLLNLLSDRGLVSITVETGQHQEAAAADRAEAAIWIAVAAAGLLPERAVPELAEARKLLRRATGHLPRALEMRFRREVVDGDGFVMHPGYENFEEVEAGQIVARDARGDVAVTEDARLLMPLYQEQGEDGFFLVREFAPFWMQLSYVLRRAGADRVARLFPGVRAVPGTDDEVLIDKGIARFFAKELFHLLGFRQLEDAGSRLLMRRRPFDDGTFFDDLPIAIGGRRRNGSPPREE